MTLTAVLLDLDGVVRHFDPEHVASVEARYGLAPGSLRKAAFTPSLIEPVLIGQTSRAEWVDAVGAAVGNVAAANEWMAERGTVDQAMITEVAALRAAGVVVSVLTNGTDTIPDEMRELDLDRHFDAIFNTAQIGYAKPDRRAFEHVCRELHAEPSAVFFTDDSASKLSGAIEIGMTARLFQGLTRFRSDLAELGITHRE